MRMLFAAAAAISMVAAYGLDQTASGPGIARASAAATAAPETRPANAPSQKPAFAGQTRAPLRAANVAFDLKTVAEGLEKPWAMAFLPDGRMLVTERPGRLRVVTTDGKLSAPVAGMPAFDTKGQGGLHDIALDPDYRTNNIVWFSYAEPRDGGNGTALAKGKLNLSGEPRIEGVQVVFRQMPTLDSALHFGSQIVFNPDGTLFFTLGERSIPAGRAQAQNLDSHFGKVVRLNKDGSVPKDNPFVGKSGAKPEIWSYGHRNVQGAALHPQTRQLWTVEHGARGGDELNIPQKGKDYGWPTITYGIEYQGGPIGQGLTARPGMEQPAYYWDPVIAPGSMTFYTADLFPAWKGSLFIGGLSSKKLVRLTLDGQKVVGEEWLLTDLNQRIRDVVQGPDGALYVVTDEDKGRVLKLTPKS